MVRLKEFVEGGSKLAVKLKVENDITPLYILEGNLLIYVYTEGHWKRVMAGGSEENDTLIIESLKENIADAFSKSFGDPMYYSEYIKAFTLAEGDIEISFVDGDVSIDSDGVKRHSMDLVKRALDELMPTTIVHFAKTKHKTKSKIKEKAEETYCYLSENLRTRPQHVAIR